MEPKRSDISVRDEVRRGIDRVDGSARILFGVRSLPALPDSVARLAHMSDDPRVGPMAFLETLLADTELSRETLAAVNRAYFAPTRPVGRVREAVTVLGTRLARYVSLVAGVRSRLLSTGPSPEGFDRPAFWRHCVATAFAAESLARSLGEPLTETCFVAGLLHDVGLLVLDRNDPEALGEIVAGMAQGRAQEEVEQETVGATHIEIGRSAGRVWGLPPIVTDAITHHHAPDALTGNSFRVAGIVRAADWVASPAERSCFGSDIVDEDDRILRMLGIESTVLTKARREIAARLDELEGLLNTGVEPATEPANGSGGERDGEVV